MTAAKKEWQRKSERSKEEEEMKIEVIHYQDAEQKEGDKEAFLLADVVQWGDLGAYLLGKERREPVKDLEKTGWN